MKVLITNWWHGGPTDILIWTPSGSCYGGNSSPGCVSCILNPYSCSEYQIPFARLIEATKGLDTIADTDDYPELFI